MITIAKPDIIKRACCAINDRTKNGSAMTLFQFGKTGGVITMMMRNENMAKLPPGFGQSCLGRRGVACINAGGKVAFGTMQQKPVIIVAIGELMCLKSHAHLLLTGGKSAYQRPVFSIESHGSAGGRESPSCNNSIEILSGDLINAIRPSRGGRLITIPASISCWHFS